jgi:PhnB protein
VTYRRDAGTNPSTKERETMPDDQTTAPEIRPAPETMLGVIPYLGLDGRAADAADFYARAFGATDLGRVPDADNPGHHMHVQVEINGRALMMTDCLAPWEAEAPKPQGFHLQLVVEDGDAWWDRAIAAGCAVVMPLERMFWGDRFGMVRDPFGVHWAINEPAPA